ncbi:hypothetical protein LguiB_028749 [Lonicera macranthoides]
MACLIGKLRNNDHGSGNAAWSGCDEVFEVHLVALCWVHGEECGIFFVVSSTLSLRRVGDERGGRDLGKDVEEREERKREVEKNGVAAEEAVQFCGSVVEPERFGRGKGPDEGSFRLSGGFWRQRKSHKFPFQNPQLQNQCIYHQQRGRIEDGAAKRGKLELLKTVQLEEEGEKQSAHNISRIRFGGEFVQKISGGGVAPLALHRARPLGGEKEGYCRGYQHKVDLLSTQGAPSPNLPAHTRLQMAQRQSLSNNTPHLN